MRWGDYVHTARDRLPDHDTHIQNYTTVHHTYNSSYNQPRLIASTTDNDKRLLANNEMHAVQRLAPSVVVTQLSRAPGQLMGYYVIQRCNQRASSAGNNGLCNSFKKQTQQNESRTQ